MEGRRGDERGEVEKERRREKGEGEKDGYSHAGHCPQNPWGQALHSIVEGTGQSSVVAQGSPTHRKYYTTLGSDPPSH